MYGDILLQRAKSHQETLRAELKSIDIPEFGTAEDGTPMRVYFYPGMSIGDSITITDRAGTSLLSQAVEMLLIAARDSEGNKAFRPAHRTELLRYMDTTIAGRIIEAMTASNVGAEEAEKN